jgi:hypothetical protein
MYPLRIFAVLQVLLIVASISSVSGMVNISSDTVKQVITDSTSPDFLKKAVYDRSNDTVELDFKIASNSSVQFWISDMNTKAEKYNKLVQFVEAGDQKYSIDMSPFPKGSYVVDFRSRGRFSGKRLIVKN